jgi:hypothetical protein
MAGKKKKKSTKKKATKKKGPKSKSKVKARAHGTALKIVSKKSSARKNNSYKVTGRDLVIPKQYLIEISRYTSYNGELVINYSGIVPSRYSENTSTKGNARICYSESDRRGMTKVNRAILDTYLNNPVAMPSLNGGYLDICEEVIEVGDNLVFKKARKFDGAQTQGMIRVGKRIMKDKCLKPHEVLVRHEIIVTNDTEHAASIAVARNQRTPVKDISIAGILKYLDELGNVFKKSHGLNIMKSETSPKKCVDTEKIFQVVYELMLDLVYSGQGELSRCGLYNSKSSVLKKFMKAYKITKKNPGDKNHAAFKEEYEFILDVFGQAHDMYNYWKDHKGLIDSDIIPVRGGEVPDGIVFPIIAGHTSDVFVKKVCGRYKVTRIGKATEKKVVKFVENEFKRLGLGADKFGKCESVYERIFDVCHGRKPRK